MALQLLILVQNQFKLSELLLLSSSYKDAFYLNFYLPPKNTEELPWGYRIKDYKTTEVNSDFAEYLRITSGGNFL